MRNYLKALAAIAAIALSLTSIASAQGVKRGIGSDEIARLDVYFKRTFGNPKIRVVARPKKDSAVVYIGEEFIGAIFVDEDDDRSFQFQMAILQSDLVETRKEPGR